MLMKLTAEGMINFDVNLALNSLMVRYLSWDWNHMQI